MKPAAIYHRAIALGLSLETDGEKLLVFGKRNDALPAELVAELREHKREILDLLETQAVALRPDEIPWLHVSRQILAGEFDGADASTVESVTIGLRSIPHPLCRSAVENLKGKWPRLVKRLLKERSGA